MVYYQKTLLAVNETYHVFNRGIDHRPTFLKTKELQRGLITLKYYQYQNPAIKLSHFLSKSQENQQKIINQLQEKGQKLVDIYSFCLMPNHFHFLLKQNLYDGISRFLSNFKNSYTRYFNVMHERVGGLFLDQFKAVRIETDEQLLHVSRYIHLNPYSSFVVKNINMLTNYEWSSLPEYLDDNNDRICVTKFILDFFKNNKDYYKFIVNQADYQRQLAKIKHLVLEE